MSLLYVLTFLGLVWCTPTFILSHSYLIFSCLPLQFISSTLFSNTKFDSICKISCVLLQKRFSNKLTRLKNLLISNFIDLSHFHHAPITTDSKASTVSVYICCFPVSMFLFLWGPPSMLLITLNNFLSYEISSF